MTKTVERVDIAKLKQPKWLRVAAYARVSSGSEEMLHSLSSQVGYYSDLIQNHGGWAFAGIFADEAKTGTRESRENFQKLIEKCRAGQVDLIITKSVSRFARNTVTLLSTIRELRDLNVDVYFEEQNLHSISSDGEMILTLIASIAQEESLSASENQKWRIRQNFENGIPWNGVMLGYRQKDKKYVVVSEEAEIVKRIYNDYLAGYGIENITNRLNKDGILTQKGFRWHKSSVFRILTNYNYTGNLVLQRFYSESHITKKKCRNNGELSKYYAEETHEAIIPVDTFMAVRKEMERRAVVYTPKRPEKDNYDFTSLITCEKCGKHYRRKVTRTGVVWICNTYNSQGKSACASKAIPEETLYQLTADTDIADIQGIIAKDGNVITVILNDGRSYDKHWLDRSRASSWTDEMRAAARAKTLERRSHNA